MRSSMMTILTKAVVPLSASLLMLASGCDLLDDEPVQPPVDIPVQPPVEQPQAQQAPDADANAEPDQESNAYMRPDFSDGKGRDPFAFRPPEPEVQKQGETRIKEPLEAYDLAQLKLVAIVTGTAVSNAMFVGPDGFGHFAKEDDRIGRDGGRISDIRTNEVEVTINPEAAVGSANDLEDGKPDGRAPAEPVTILIRLSDTEIPVPGADEEEESILDKLDADKAEGKSSPAEPQAPAIP